VVIGTDCIGGYKSNYHTITTTTAPAHNFKEDTDCIDKGKLNYNMITAKMTNILFAKQAFQLYNYTKKIVKF